MIKTQKNQCLSEPLKVKIDFYKINKILINLNLPRKNTTKSQNLILKIKVTSIKECGIKRMKIKLKLQKIMKIDVVFNKCREINP